MTDEISTDIQATYGQFESIVTTGEIASDTIRVEEIESERNTVTDQLNVEGNILASGITTSNFGFMFGHDGQQHYLYESSPDTVSLKITSEGPYAQFKDVSGDVQMGSASGKLRLSAGGNEKLSITTDGNVNIGVNHSSNPFSYLRFGGSQYGAADIRPTDEASHKIGLSFYTDGTQDTTINPTEKLRIKCTGAIGVGTTAYEGTSGQVLTSLGSTSPTWRHANTPMWHGSPTTDTAAAQVVAGDGNYYTVTALTVDSIDIDKAHGGWNAATGVFTVPTGDAGIYFVYGITAIDDIDGGDWVRCAFSINGAGINHWTGKYLGGDAFNNLITNSGTYSKLVSLSEGDTIEMKVRHSDNSANRKIRGNRTHFGGYRLSA